MNEEEVRRAGVLKRVKAAELKQVEAAEILGLSYRQVKRIYGKYLEGGAKALVHGNAGKPSNRAWPSKERKRVLRLVEKHYGGDPGKRFGPTLAAEHLAEDHGLEVDAETLRRWMLDEGLCSRERKRKPYRQRRLRRGHFGELVQMDGSFEDWLERRGPRGCLIHMVDDATSRSLGTFTLEETTWGVADTLRAWVEKYGIPRAIYVDWKGGGQLNFLAGFGDEWWSRWRRAMAGGFNPQRLDRYRGLGIDYLVLERKNRMAAPAPVYENTRFVVYAVSPSGG